MRFRQPSMYSCLFRMRRPVFAKAMATLLLSLPILTLCSCVGDKHRASADPLSQILYPPPPKDTIQALPEQTGGVPQEVQVAVTPKVEKKKNKKNTPFERQSREPQYPADAYAANAYTHTRAYPTNTYPGTAYPGATYPAFSGTLPSQAQQDRHFASMQEITPIQVGGYPYPTASTNPREPSLAEKLYQAAPPIPPEVLYAHAANSTQATYPQRFNETSRFADPSPQYAHPRPAPAYQQGHYPQSPAQYHPNNPLPQTQQYHQSHNSNYPAQQPQNTHIAQATFAPQYATPHTLQYMPQQAPQPQYSQQTQYATYPVQPMQVLPPQQAAQNPGMVPQPGTYPPQYQQPQYPVPQYPAPQYPAPQYQQPQYPSPQHQGTQYPVNPSTGLPYAQPPSDPIRGRIVQNADHIERAPSVLKPVVFRRVVDETEEIGDMETTKAKGAEAKVENTSGKENAEKKNVPNETTPSRSHELIVNPQLRERGAGILQQHRNDGDRFKGVVRPLGIVGHWPQDEYLADGGDDRGRFLVREDWSYQGLQMEDTVAHYDTVDGRMQVEASNRVHLYAPRFGSVRKVEESLSSKHRVFVTGAGGSVGSASGRGHEGLGFTEQEVKIEHAKTRISASGTQGRRLVGGVHAEDGTVRIGGLDSPMSYMNLLTTTHLGDAQILYLAEGAEAARAWAGVESVKVRLNNLAAMSIAGDQGATQTFAIEEGESVSKLRLIKVASKKAALPGDAVEFMLRFDNLGNRPLGNVTLLDNLATRLELVPDSVQCSVAAGFVVEPNEGGSSILRFEITEPLLPGQFGVVRFECRLR